MAKERNELTRFDQWITAESQSENAEDHGLLDAAIPLGTLGRLHSVHG